MSYVGKTFALSRNSYATSTTGTTDFNFDIYEGDTFTVKRESKDSSVYVAVYHGPKNQDRVGTEFGVVAQFMDNFCTNAKTKKQKSPCHCTNFDITYYGHLPTCEFILAGGCKGSSVR